MKRAQCLFRHPAPSLFCCPALLLMSLMFPPCLPLPPPLPFPSLPRESFLKILSVLCRPRRPFLRCLPVPCQLFINPLSALPSPSALSLLPLISPSSPSMLSARCIVYLPQADCSTLDCRPISLPRTLERATPPLPINLSAQSWLLFPSAPTGPVIPTAPPGFPIPPAQPSSFVALPSLWTSRPSSATPPPL